MADSLINYYTILHLSSSNWYTQQLSLHQFPPLYFFQTANRFLTQRIGFFAKAQATSSHARVCEQGNDTC